MEPGYKEKININAVITSVSINNLTAATQLSDSIVNHQWLTTSNESRQTNFQFMVTVDIFMRVLII